MSMPDDSEEKERTARKLFVAEREEIWLLARNLLKSTYEDSTRYEPGDILDVCIFISGDSLEPTPIQIVDVRDDSEEEEEAGDEPAE